MITYNLEIERKYFIRWLNVANGLIKRNKSNLEISKIDTKRLHVTATHIILHAVIGHSMPNTSRCLLQQSVSKIGLCCKPLDKSPFCDHKPKTIAHTSLWNEFYIQVISLDKHLVNVGSNCSICL
jgi:hypothetical protein